MWMLFYSFWNEVLFGSWWYYYSKDVVVMSLWEDGYYCILFVVKFCGMVLFSVLLYVRWGFSDIVFEFIEEDLYDML